MVRGVHLQIVEGAIQRATDPRPLVAMEVNAPKPTRAVVHVEVDGKSHPRRRDVGTEVLLDVAAGPLPAFLPAPEGDPDRAPWGNADGLQDAHRLGTTAHPEASSVAPVPACQES
jgi:hypothetical protein